MVFTRCKEKTADKNYSIIWKKQKYCPAHLMWKENCSEVNGSKMKSHESEIPKTIAEEEGL